MKPPRRLLDDAALAPTLRGDLERTAASACAYDSTAGLAALQVALGVSVVAVAGGAAPAVAAAPNASAAAAAAPAVKSAALLGAAGAKVGVSVVAATAAVMIASALVTSERSAPGPSHARTRAIAAPAPATPADSDLASVAEPVMPQPPARANVPAPASPAQLTPARTHALGERARREIAQLGRIKVLLAHDPARAYAAAQSGHREFPRGILRHEREGLAVLALFALGRRAEAEARARAFLERHPSSPLRAQIEQCRRAP
jgi:hypothetical protein